MTRKQMLKLLEKDKEPLEVSKGVFWQWLYHGNRHKTEGPLVQRTHKRI